jgi:hypothetical protein
MSEAALQYPYPSREDEYFQALEAYLRTTADDGDVVDPPPDMEAGRAGREVHAGEFN